MLLLRVLAALAVLLALLPAAPAGAGPAWGWPLAGVPAVSRPFAPGPTPYSPGHRGVDLTARRGAAVLSAGAGVVAYAGPLAGRGVVVVVHGVLRTTYEPVEAAVRVGQLVLRGERIGTLQPGHRGCPAAACLHWGLRRGRDHLDPLRLVGAARVRLLPWGAGVAGPASAGAGTARAAAPPGAAPAGAGPARAAAPAEPDPVPAAVASARAAPAAASGPGSDPAGPSRRLTAGAAVLAGLLVTGTWLGRRRGVGRAGRAPPLVRR